MKDRLNNIMKSDPKTIAKLSIGSILVAVTILSGLKGLFATLFLGVGGFLGVLALSKFLDMFFEKVDNPEN